MQELAFETLQNALLFKKNVFIMIHSSVLKNLKTIRLHY